MHRRKWIRVYSSNAYRKKSPNTVKKPIPSKKRRKTTGNAILSVSKLFKRKQMNSSANWRNCLMISTSSNRKIKSLQPKTPLHNKTNYVLRNCSRQMIQRRFHLALSSLHKNA